MRRFAAIAFLALAIPLLIALATFWTRSLFVWDSVFFETADRAHMLESSRGRIGWCDVRQRWGTSGVNWGSYRVEGKGGTILDDAIVRDNSVRAWGGFVVSTRGTQFASRTVAAPYWFLTLVIGTPAALVWRVGRRRRLRITRGQCERCGYDLRATPERCPECGAIPQNYTARREEVSSSSAA